MTSLCLSLLPAGLEILLFSNKRAEEYNRACLDAMVVANTKISTKIPGQVGYNRGMDHDKETKRAQAIREQVEFSWLYKG